MKFSLTKYIYSFSVFSFILLLSLSHPRVTEATDQYLARYFVTPNSKVTSILFNTSVIAPDPEVVYDDRADRLELFFARYHSPLTDYTDTFIMVADKYHLDWRLLPAITGVESTFGRFIPVGSYNAYGWNRGNFRFNSWEHSIEYIGRNLSEKYLARGLITPNEIGTRYAPDSTTWASKVTHFISQIDSTKI